MVDSTGGTAERRIIELDALRGLAAVGVLVTHLPRGYWFGETGVDLFFVLSGYLITAIILRNREHHAFLRVFYFRRALRIFPVYYLAVIGVLVLNRLRTTPGSTEGIEFYLAYLQNIHQYFGGSPPQPDLSLGHTWTLAIEEQYYLLWPAAIVFLKPRRAFWICVLLCVMPVVLRAQGLSRETLLGHTDGLALGACLAFAGSRYSSAFSASMAPIYLALVVVGFGAYGALWAELSSRGMTGKEMVKETYGILLVTFAYTALIALVLSLAGSRWLSVLRFGPLVWVGSISYGLYLYHWIIYEQLDTVIKFGRGYNDPWWLDLIKVSLSFVAAALSWCLIERPLLKLKDAVSYGSRKLQCAAVPARLTAKPAVVGNTISE